MVNPVAAQPPRGRTRRQWFRLATGTAVAGPALLACGPLGAPSGAGPGQAGACRSKLEWYEPFPVTEVRYEGYQQVIREFTARRAGCAVEMVVVPDLLPKLITAQAAGTPPALTAMAPSGVTGWSTQGVLAAVDDLFKRDKLSGADFPPPLWKQMNYGGKVWFTPLECNADFVLHWNKAHFREAGLNPEQGPETIDELDKLIPLLTRQRGDELERAGMQPWDLYGAGNTIQAWGYAFGGAFKDEAKDELTFNHPRIQRAVEWYTGWAKRIGAERVTKLTQAVAVPGVHFFGTGRLSLHGLTSSTLRGAARERAPGHDAGMEIGAGPMPGEAPGKPGTVSIGGWDICAVAGNPGREEAWDFMRYIGASDEGTLTIARKVGIPGWLKSPGLAELSKDALQKGYVDGVRRAQFPQLGFYSPGGYNLNPIQDIIDGKSGVRDAMEAINREANQRYQEWKSRVKK